MKATLILAATACLFAPLASLGAADAPKPNIVLIMADDQGWGDTGYNGHPELKTPNLDALAASGLRLNRFYAAHCNCSPTRGSVMTGRHPNRYGTFQPGAPIRAQELTVAKVLQSAGYATGHFGKWHLNGKNGDKNTTAIPGRAILADDPLSPGKMGFDEWVSADNFFDLDPVLGRNGVPEKFHGDSSDITTDEALKFIRKQATANKPFLSVVWLGSPHVPHLALPADKAANSALSEKEQNYFGEIAAVDRSVGRLRAALRDLKIADNTLLWYCSDNGGHEGPKSTGYLRGEKGSLWEGGLRVPGIVEWPARISTPCSSETPCSTLDIYPTVLEATGAIAQQQIQPLDGVSLLPLFADPSESRSKPIPFWDHGTGHAAWLDWPYKLHLKPVTTRYTKSKADRDLPATLLYDVSKDPKESTDLAAQEPERVAKMTAALQTWKASVENSLSGADYGGWIAPPAKRNKKPANKPKQLTAKPNIVVVLADDMGYGDPACYNPQSKIATPTIDRLAREGMRFTDAHAPGALCHPSRYGLMTGCYPFRTDITRWPENPLIADGQMTVASLLREQGYRTAMVGKWHLGFRENGYDQPLPGGPVDRGFDSFFGLRASTDIPPYFYIRDRRAVNPPTAKIAENHSAGWSPTQGAFWREGGIAPGLELKEVLPKLTEEACSIIDAHGAKNPTARQPLMLYLALTAPHTPWLPAPEFVGKSGAGMYGDFAMMVDTQIGRVLAALDKADLAKNTLLIFTSDNGPVWRPEDKDRLGHDASGGLRGMKGDAWEGGHRMPFIVRWPDQVKAGSVSHQTICFTDLLATFADVTGTKLPAEAGPDSFSFLPVLRGTHPAEQPIRGPIVMQAGSSSAMMIRSGDWKLINQLGSGGFSQPKTIQPEPNGPTAQLYNLRNDLAETTNLYLKHPEIVARLEAEMQRIMKAQQSH